MEIIQPDVRKDDGFWLTRKAGIGRAMVEDAVRALGALTLTPAGQQAVGESPALLALVNALFDAVNG